MIAKSRAPHHKHDLVAGRHGILAGKTTVAPKEGTLAKETNELQKRHVTSPPPGVPLPQRLGRLYARQRSASIVRVRRVDFPPPPGKNANRWISGAYTTPVKLHCRT